MVSQSPKRLYRSRHEKMIAGVCGGLAKYWNIDPVIIRIVAVLLIFVNGIGLLAYLIAWIIIPLEPAAKVEVVQKPVKKKAAKKKSTERAP